MPSTKAPASRSDVREAMPDPMRYWVDLVRTTFNTRCGKDTVTLRYIKTPTLEAGRDIADV